MQKIDASLFFQSLNLKLFISGNIKKKIKYTLLISHRRLSSGVGVSCWFATYNNLRRMTNVADFFFLANKEDSSLGILSLPPPLLFKIRYYSLRKSAKVCHSHNPISDFFFDILTSAPWSNYVIMDGQRTCERTYAQTIL